MSWKKSIDGYVREIGKARGQYRALLLLTPGFVTVALGYVGFASQLPGKHYPMDLLYRSGGLFAFKGAEDMVPGRVKDAVKKTSPFLVHRRISRSRSKTFTAKR